MKNLLLLFCLILSLNSIAQLPTIYLNFNGATLTNTTWNTDRGMLNLDSSGISEYDQQQILRQVQEDFIPFDITITLDSREFEQAPLKQRMQVIITKTNEWYETNVGGIAMTGSFIWGDNTPCFVFSKLLNYNVKNIAEAISHETGHTLGLKHQATYTNECNMLSEYNIGKSGNEISWGPIMGGAYNRKVTQWFMGPTSSGCADIENEIDIITKNNNISFRKDDYPQIENVEITNNQIAKQGIIETSLDRDTFKISISVFSKVHFSISPYYYAPNLDVKTSLLNSNFNKINEYNNPVSLTSEIDTSLNSGVYYLIVEGDTSVNYSKYGSLGQYSMIGEVIAMIPLSLTKIDLKGAVKNNQHILNWSIATDSKIDKLQLISSNNITALPLSSTSLSLAATKKEQYTLVATVEGKKVFSNSIILNSPSTDYTLITKHNSIIIYAKTPLDYQIYDLSGRLIQKGKLSVGENNFYLSRGNYIFVTQYRSDKIMLD